MSTQIYNQQQNQQNNQSSEISVRESLRILDNEKEFLKAFDAGTLDQKIRQKMIKEDMLRVELDGEKVSVDKKKADINKVKWYEVAVGILTLGIGGAIVHHFRKKSDHKDLEAEIQGEMDKVRNAIRTELSAMDENDKKNIVDMVKKDAAKCFKEFMQNNNNAMFETLKDKINKGEINDKEFRQTTDNLFKVIQSLDSGKSIDDNLKNYINAISGDTPVQTAQAGVQAKPNPMLIAENQAQERLWKTMKANNEVENYDKILGDIFKDKKIGDTVNISALKLTGLQDGDFVKLCPISGGNKYVQITSRERNEAVLVTH